MLKIIHYQSSKLPPIYLDRRPPTFHHRTYINITRNDAFRNMINKNI